MNGLLAYCSRSVNMGLSTTVQLESKVELPKKRKLHEKTQNTLCLVERCQ